MASHLYATLGLFSKDVLPETTEATNCPNQTNQCQGDATWITVQQTQISLKVAG